MASKHTQESATISDTWGFFHVSAGGEGAGGGVMHTVTELGCREATPQRRLGEEGASW